MFRICLGTHRATLEQVTDGLGYTRYECRCDCGIVASSFSSRATLRHFKFKHEREEMKNSAHE